MRAKTPSFIATSLKVAWPNEDQLKVLLANLSNKVFLNQVDQTTLTWAESITGGALKAEDHCKLRVTSPYKLFGSSRGRVTPRRSCTSTTPAWASLRPLAGSSFPKSTAEPCRTIFHPRDRVTGPFFVPQWARLKPRLRWTFGPPFPRLFSAFNRRFYGYRFLQDSL